jgi:hypothetical protein
VDRRFNPGCIQFEPGWFILGCPDDLIMRGGGEAASSAPLNAIEIRTSAGVVRGGP